MIKFLLEITYYIIFNGVLICFEYPSKHGRLHQGLHYIVYLWYCIDFDNIAIVLKV